MKMSVNVFRDGKLLKVSGGGGFGEVDSVLSPTSENPVQNKVITGEINGLKEIIPQKPANNAAAHNGIFIGKDLTGLTLDEICAPIADNSFEDRYIGDYFDITISTPYTANEVVRCILAGFNPYWNNGRTPFVTPHAAIVTKNCFTATHAMNATNTTEGGFIGSDMWKTILPAYEAALRDKLGDHLLTHNTLLTNVMNPNLNSNAGAGFKGASNGWEYIDACLSLLSEIQVYGCNVFSSSFYDTGCDNLQLPLFALDPTAKVCGKNTTTDGNGDGGRRQYWLKNVANATGFATASNGGNSYYSGAAYIGGVRPIFCIG